MKRIDIRGDPEEQKWKTYEAIIKDAVFEWPSPLPETTKESQLKCIEYLDQLFTEYTVKDFYLRGKEVTKEKK